MRNPATLHQPTVETEIQSETKRLLKEKKEFPSVSFLLPVDLQYPKVREEEKKLRAMMKEAGEKLEKLVPAKSKDALAIKFKKVLETVDFSRLSRSLAVFVSPSKQKIVHLPFSVKAKIIISDSFELRDLLYAAKHSFHYLVLAISEKKTRLFLGYNHHLSEEDSQDFPHGMTDTGGKGHSRTQKFGSSAPSRHVSDQFEHQEIQMEKYLRDIDKIIAGYLGGRNIPIFLVGERKVTDKFRALSKNPDRISGTVEGNYDRSTSYVVYSKIEALLKDKLKIAENNALAMLEDAVSRRRSASGISEVWKTVMEKRGRLLLVEKDFRCSGKIGNNKYTLLVNNVKENGSYIIPDAVDDIIEYVLLYGGDVAFVENGALAEHQKIALITYYA